MILITVYKDTIYYYLSYSLMTLCVYSMNHLKLRSSICITAVTLYLKHFVFSFSEAFSASDRFYCSCSVTFCPVTVCDEQIYCSSLEAAGTKSLNNQNEGSSLFLLQCKRLLSQVNSGKSCVKWVQLEPLIVLLLNIKLALKYPVTVNVDVQN